MRIRIEPKDLGSLGGIVGLFCGHIEIDVEDVETLPAGKIIEGQYEPVETPKPLKSGEDNGS